MNVSGFVSSFRRCFPDLVGRPVLVALSGGADSVALLHLMLAARAELGCPVAAAHVNHHARLEADDDELFCRELCRELGVEIEVRHLREALPVGLSREAWWRQQRYERLEAVRRMRACAATATAHTRDDQAETVLLKLLRGSGPRGVIGIRQRLGAFVRPLLDVGREELRSWLEGIGGCWREDLGNADPGQPRAWLRVVALPALEERFPGSTRHLAGFTAALADDDEALSHLAAALPRPESGRPVACEAVAGMPARCSAVGCSLLPPSCRSASRPTACSSRRSGSWWNGACRRRSTSGGAGCYAGVATACCSPRRRWRRSPPARSRSRPASDLPDTRA